MTAPTITGGAVERVAVGRSRVTAWAAAAAVPWLWFVLRDRLGIVTDLAAIVVPILAAAGALAAVLVARAWRPALATAVSMVIVGIVATVGPWLPGGEQPIAAGAATTLLASNIDTDSVTAVDVLGTDPDILVISEVTEALDRGLRVARPHTVETLLGPKVGVYSRHPLTVLDAPSAELPGWRLQVEGPGGPFVLYALHVPRPWFRAGTFQTSPTNQRRIIEATARSIEAETLPVVVAGDLNVTDRSRSFRLLTERTDDAVTGWGRPTSKKWWLLAARIDHVLVDDTWCRGPSRYVDVPLTSHLAVAATFGPCDRR